MKNMENREFIRVIEQRRSIRSFENRPVEKEILDKLKELTLRAPSGGNMVMYSIVEVNDREKKERLAKICDNQIMIEKAPIVWVYLADMQKWVNYFMESGCKEKSGIDVRRPGIGDFHLAMQDTVIAAQTTVLAAEALGLGSCYIGDIIENYEQLQALLDLPPLAAPACCLIMGYPKRPTSPMQRRPPKESIFMENSYAEPHLEELEKMYKDQEDFLREHKTLPYDNNGTIADYYYNRKYTSAFMKEMNRSTSVFLKRWAEGD